MWVDVYVQCLIHHFNFVSYCIYFIYTTAYFSILQNKHLAYKDSIGNCRLNYISKKCSDRGWD